MDGRGSEELESRVRLIEIPFNLGSICRSLS